MEVKRYEDNSAGLYQITTTQYGSDGQPGEVASTTANGLRPGGPGRATGPGGSSASEPEVFATVISLKPSAKDVTITNKSLLPEHLTIIANQAKKQSGSIEYEISATLAGALWIRRGMYLTFTGLRDEQDGLLPDMTALVSDCRFEYRESSEHPAYRTYIKALFWKDGEP